jgi:hypothetical protein
MKCKKKRLLYRTSSGLGASFVAGDDAAIDEKRER